MNTKNRDWGTSSRLANLNLKVAGVSTAGSGHGSSDSVPETLPNELYGSPVGGVEYCDKRVLSVRLFVCLFARISQEPHVQILLLIFFCECSCDRIAWFSSGSVAIRYILPVLWMTLCFTSNWP